MKNNLAFFIVLAVLLSMAYCYKKLKKEGFVPSYADCRSGGYTKEFCLQTPNIFGPDICPCPDGQMGRRLPGFRGACVCPPMPRFSFFSSFF